jgi:thiol-disulfide isomerase/thioredoxin
VPIASPLEETMSRTCLFACLSLALNLTPSAAAVEDTQPLALGSPAPDFALPGVDGKTHALKDFAAAKLLAILFTCNHCPTAQAYEERLKKLAADYREKGVALVAISPNDPAAVRLDELGYTDLGDSLEDMKVRARDRSFNFPYLYDGETQKVSRAYGPVATPHVFLFDAERKLRYLGRIDDSEREAGAKSPDLRNAIDALLAGKAPPVEKTKTFGCSIKWGDKRAGVASAAAKADGKPVALEAIGPEGVRKLVANQAAASGGRGKLILLNVWATTCAPCVKEFPELVTMQRMYGHRDFELVTVSADQPAAKGTALEFLKKQNASSRNYFFDQEDKAKLIEAVDAKWEGAIPYTLLVRPGGEVAYRKMGPIDPLEVRRAIVKNLTEDRG